jgi:CTP:molybdopterin cytidylyltransferase MocA
MRFAAIVLAAGRGLRAGGPKALATDAAGRPLGAVHARAALEAGASSVVLVVREDVASALRPHLPEEVVVVVSREPDEDGPAGSLRAAYPCWATSDVEALLVTPVDKRAATPSLIEALLSALERGADAARPIHGGRGGHPVALRPSVLAPYAPAAGSAPPPLRDVLRALDGGRRVDVPAGPEALDDLDDADALRRVLGAP